MNPTTETLTPRLLVIAILRFQCLRDYWKQRAEADPWDDTADWCLRRVSADLAVLRGRLEEGR